MRAPVSALQEESMSRPEPAPRAADPQGALRVAVVGGGLAGLTAAPAVRTEAARRGVRLELAVYESGDRAGGQLTTLREGGYLVDWGANAFRTGLGPSLDLLDELGLSSERVEASRAANRRFVFHGGRLHAFPSDPIGLLGFRPLSLAGRLRVMAEPIVARRVAHEESVHAYAARHVGSEAAQVLLGTMVRGVYGGDARALSVDAAFPVMRTMEREHRSLVVAGVAGARARKRLGKTTWSLARGMGSLLEALADTLAPDVHLRSPVAALTNSEGGDGRAYRLRLADGQERVADAVVVATPPTQAARLLERLDVAAAGEIGGIATAAVAVVALGYPKDAFRRPPEGYGFLVAPGEGPRILGALFESNLFPNRAPAGHVLVRAILGGVERPDVATTAEAVLVDDVRAALAAALGSIGEPTRVWVEPRAGAIPQYLLGHRERIARLDARLARYPGVRVIGNAYRGVAVGSIVEEARAVARTLLDGALRRREPEALAV